jgi:hypothetical protein
MWMHRPGAASQESHRRTALCSSHLTPKPSTGVLSILLTLVSLLKAGGALSIELSARHVRGKLLTCGTGIPAALQDSLC